MLYYSKVKLLVLTAPHVVYSDRSCKRYVRNKQVVCMIYMVVCCTAAADSPLISERQPVVLLAQLVPPLFIYLDIAMMSPTMSP